MKRNYLLFVGVFIFMAFQVNAQYCVPGITNPCAPEEINNVTLESIDNTTGCNATPSDYTNQIADVTIGETYQLSVTIVADGGFPDDYAIAYIDWNQDEAFDFNTERYPIVGPTGASGTYSINIEVPVDAEEGETRMRVLVNWNQPDHDGCEQLNYGEVEDYTINVSTLSIVDNNIDGFNYFYSTPTKDLTITANGELANITMFNLLGQQVINKSLGSNNETVNLSNLNDGIYLATVRTLNGSVSTFKMVKR